ncbi:hypothetical protein CFR75_08100 [Komagataeibacter xylinus]|uniref:Uncharacterized protein n=1 Tax=Komagataeibacter xylinus TaxID=28448 RepID=A0A318PIC8_KOMXY|nr:hypothetical protein [Komagataeibacter xylinus]AZV38884.1 hypothetical protein CXP35_08820 [Komagataeibacter xylinus]PYD57034.1 hypothetical protein CFR75_08100 [Komagataeibacter xylinus]GBQ71444.1 hypothetical protein AA15237_1097 [Komagataeibacter xylinus NBRC 15237]
MTTMLNPSLSPMRSPATRRAMTHVTTFIREAWIVPMVVMGSVLCGGVFTLLSHLLGHAG